MEETIDTPENASLHVKDLVTHYLSEERMMRSEDLARLMGWSQRTLTAKLARREVPNGIRVKRLVLFKYSDVSEWLAKNANKIEPEPKHNLGVQDAVAALLK